MHRTKTERNRAGVMLTVFLTVGLGLFASGSARGHFLWIKVKAGGPTMGGSTIRVFLNETPEPRGPEFLKLVRDIVPTSDGIPLETYPADETMDATWVGKLPPTIDAERDFGLRTKGELTYRLY